jgi:hypothetical protein
VTEDDKPLVEELRALGRAVDPVPDGVASFAKAALGWRRIDAELAELLEDSALEEPVALTRGSLARTRSVTFEASDLELDVDIQLGDRGVVLLGQLAPPAAATVEAQRDDGSIAASAETDDRGRFRLELAEGGRLRLLVRRGQPAPPVETSWLTI